MLEPWRTGIVIKMLDATATTRRFWIQVPELEVFNFTPGQFVTLDLPIHEKRNKRWRSYSIASHPDGTNIFELVIVWLADGAGTTYLFNEIKIGSTILFRGPQGIFVLPDQIEKDLFLICTGTGIAPFRSMVQHIYTHSIVHKNIYLLFGCRNLKDTLYEKELMELEHHLKGFYYLPVFSRELPNEKIRTGYVHSVYEKIITELRPEASFFLCGWKNMIDEAREKITSLGYEKKDIHFELYG